jgi:hypothetical protein
MSAMFDVVASSILFGILILAVARVQGNLNSTMYQNTYNMTTQTTAVEIARQVEHDFTKIGYRVTGQKVFTADSTEIRFSGALSYGGPIESVRHFWSDSPDTTTMNPLDHRLIRATTSGGAISQRLGITVFQLTYFDTLHNRIPTPVTGLAALSAIRSIKVQIRFESFEPIPEADTSLYFAVNWEKIIYPRNLGKPK